MGIGSITSASRMQTMQTTAANLKDQKSKNIQSEIADVQQQIQKLSSKEDLSANEKTNERKKLQQEISGLNTELKQHQEELRKSHKREIMMAKLQEDVNPAKEEPSEDKAHPDDSSLNATGHNSLPPDEQDASRTGTVIAQNGDGSVILKETLTQDANRATDANTKQVIEPEEEAIVEQEEETAEDDMVTDAGLSGQKVHAMVSADSFLQQASRQGTIVARTKDGIAILKSEINLDKDRDTDTRRKEAELEKMEKRRQRAMEAQFALLGEANNAMKSASETKESAKDKTQTTAGNSFSISGINTLQEEQAEQQRFYVSVG